MTYPHLLKGQKINSSVLNAGENVNRNAHFIASLNCHSTLTYLLKEKCKHVHRKAFIQIFIAILSISM